MYKFVKNVFLLWILAYSAILSANYNTNDVKINANIIETDGKVIIKSVEIETTNLRLIPVTSGDVTFYCSLYGNPVNMQYYLGGETKDENWVKARLDTWSARWQTGNPFSAFKITLKRDGTPIGHVVNGVGESTGQSSFAIVIDHAYRQKNERYGSEVSDAMFQHWIPYLHKLKQEVCSGTYCQVHATALTPNVKSWALLEKHGFKLNKTQPRTILDQKSNKVEVEERIYYKDLN